MIKPGDYVTGTDQSYPRSIYRFIRSHREGESAIWEVDFISFDGMRLTRVETLGKPIYLAASLYRLATEEEIKEEMVRQLFRNG